MSNPTPKRGQTPEREMPAAASEGDPAALPIGIVRLATGIYRKPSGATWAPGAYDTKGDALHRAAHAGRVDLVVRRLDEPGVVVDVRDSAGMTPLMVAAAHGELSIAKLLLAAGADPLARSPEGRRPLDFAAAAADVRPRSESAAGLREVLGQAARQASSRGLAP